MKKRTSWNKGLTKKTSKSLRAQAKKKSDWWKSGDRKKTRELIGLASKQREHPKGEKATGWKGGRVKNRGYIYIYNPEHPDSTTRGYVFEHRLVMEKVLGKRLLKDDDVNHINGKKDDNRPENLRLVKHYAHYEEICCPKCDYKFVTK